MTEDLTPLNRARRALGRLAFLLTAPDAVWLDFARIDDPEQAPDDTLAALAVVLEARVRAMAQAFEHAKPEPRALDDETAALLERDMALGKEIGERMAERIGIRRRLQGEAA